MRHSRLLRKASRLPFVGATNWCPRECGDGEMALNNGERYAVHFMAYLLAMHKAPPVDGRSLSLVDIVKDMDEVGPCEMGFLVVIEHFVWLGAALTPGILEHVAMKSLEKTTGLDLSVGAGGGREQ
jgi:hypothetical protein